MNMAKISLSRGAEHPYDRPDQYPDGTTFPAVDWAHAAARGVLADLTDRRAIKNELGDVDESTRRELVHSLATVIREAEKQRPGSAPLHPTDETEETAQLRRGVTQLVHACHGASVANGWWNDLHTNEPLLLTQERVGDKLMLIVTEIAEAKEGHRKDLMDTHLTDRKMVEVELADAVIRIADLSGALRLDLAGAIIAKLAYNAKRADHTREARTAENGKKT